MDKDLRIDIRSTGGSYRINEGQDVELLERTHPPTDEEVAKTKEELLRSYQGLSASLEGNLSATSQSTMARARPGAPVSNGAAERAAKRMEEQNAATIGADGQEVEQASTVPDRGKGKEKVSITKAEQS